MLFCKGIIPLFYYSYITNSSYISNKCKVEINSAMMTQIRQLPERLLDEMGQTLELHVAAVPVERKSNNPSQPQGGLTTPALKTVLDIVLRKLDQSPAWRRAAAAEAVHGSPQYRERSLTPLLIRAFVERVSARGQVCTYGEARKDTELLSVEDAEAECFKEFMRRMQFAGNGDPNCKVAVDAKNMACKEFLRLVTDVTNIENVTERYR